MWLERKSADLPADPPPPSHSPIPSSTELQLPVMESWLAGQCEMLSGVTQAILCLGPPDQGPYVPSSYWPSDSKGSQMLANAANVALHKRQAVMSHSDKEAGVRYRKKSPDKITTLHTGGQKDVLAYPITINQRMHGAIAVELYPCDPEQKFTGITVLRLGVLWLQHILQQNQRNIDSSASAVLGFVTHALGPEHIQAATSGLATELATQLHCDRVAIGLINNRQVKLQAISHSAKFSAKQNLIIELEALMEESLEQETMVVVPKNDNSLQIDRAHLQFSENHKVQSLCTVPMFDRQRLLGAITLERTHFDQKFDANLLQLVEQTAAVVGPILAARQVEESGVLAQIKRSIQSWLQKLLGPAHLSLKVGVGSIALVALVLSLSSMTYEVSADAVLEGTIERVVTSPQTGFIHSASARPGDLVEQGDNLAKLDDRDLKVEQLKWLSKLRQVTQEYRRALANHDRAQIAILRAQLNQAEAQLELLNKRLARTTINAPLTGMIISGDLAQSLGSPVERGQVLYKVAPLNDYRVLLEVDETDIRNIELGQTGKISLTATAGETLPFEVTKITPVAKAENEKNFYRVEATLKQSADYLRPGMQGVAKIEINSRRVIWIVTHSLVDWLRLAFWKWLP